MSDDNVGENASIEDVLDNTVYEPEAQDEIPFRGRRLVAAKLADGQGYVSLNSVAAAFGITRQALFARLNRKNDWFSPYIARIRLQTAGGPQAMVCMNAVALPLFLAGTSLESVKDPEARSILAAFLSEARDVLAEHFGITERGEMDFMRATMARLVAEREAEDRGLEGRAKQAYVDEQIAQVRREHEEKIEQVRKAYSDLRTQIRAATPNPERLTPEQVGQVSNTVRALGYLLQERGVNNPYPRVYGTIWRMAGVGATERIPQGKFEEIMTWMEKQIQILSQAQRLSPEQEDNLLDGLDL
jgi:P22_AR N-terminal domain